MNDRQHEPFALTERKKAILRAVIDVHIRMGEPVGSKFLLQDQQFSLSSATIRNEMAELEEMGYLEQPHTSAGRIPSPAGYRLYVDSLMTRYSVSKQETTRAAAIAAQKTDAVKKVLEQASRLVTEFTQYTSLYMYGGEVAESVLRFNSVWVDDVSFILVMTLSDGSVQSRGVQSPIPLDPDGLKSVTEVLNRNLSDVPMEKINLPLILRMEEQLGRFGPVMSPVMKTVYDIIGDPSPVELHFTGLNRILRYPEFSDILRVQKLFDLFESEEEITRLILDAVPGKVQIVIGSQTEIPGMEGATMIFRSFAESGHPISAIGLIGPSRMEYARSVALIGLLADNVERSIGHTA
ncbi:MAG: heat-inducible transcription repressor HrcA [Clostridia bacterium]|nr:heat-inducible transcription repressor HrcA [Clostridia bacterium]